MAHAVQVLAWSRGAVETMKLRTAQCSFQTRKFRTELPSVPNEAEQLTCVSEVAGAFKWSRLMLRIAGSRAGGRVEGNLVDPLSR